MVRSFPFGIAAFSAITLFSLSASAQAVPTAQTGTASAGRVQEQIEQPEFRQTAGAPVEVRNNPVQAAPAGADKITFVLNGVAIDGVSVYGQDRMRVYYADKIGKTISLADLYAIAAQVTNTFRNDGYILTQVIVPPQALERSGSVVKLQVVEGYVDHIDVALEQNAPAEPDTAINTIRSIAGHIRTGRALNVQDLERYMLLINDLPGVSARGILAPSATKTGAADLTILVQRKAYDAAVSLDNYGTRYLGPHQFSGAVSSNSLFGYNERLTAQAVIAPEFGEDPELAYLALDYQQPLFSNGLKLDMGVNHTETKPGYNLRQFDVRGHATFYEAGLSYPVIRSRATSVYTRGSFDLRDVNSSNNLEPTRRDRIRVLRGDLRAEHLDTLFGAGLSTADLEISRGVDIFGASDENDPNKSRPDGEPDFLKVNLEVQRLQRLADHWNLLLGARGQLSDSPLLTSEQFGVGGMAYGRGYDPSEIIGDAGFASKVELQWNLPGAFSITHDNQLYGFYDFGKVWTRNAIADQETGSTASTGLGVRSKILRGMDANFTVALPLTRDVQTENDKDPRVFFSIAQKF